MFTIVTGNVRNVSEGKIEPEFIFRRQSEKNESVETNMDVFRVSWCENIIHVWVEHKTTDCETILDDFSSKL